MIIPLLTMNLRRYFALSFWGLLVSANCPALLLAGPVDGPVRVLFVGHRADHHPSDLYYPKLVTAFGRI